MQTVSRHLQGQENALKLAAHLVMCSQWFAVTPMPDDCWVFEVKEEQEADLFSEEVPDAS